MALERESATSVQFAFALNLSHVVHQLLASQLAYPALLQSYADLSDPGLDKEVGKAVAALSAKAYFTLPSGAKNNLNSDSYLTSKRCGTLSRPSCCFSICRPASLRTSP
jgi:hypothetical protein